MLLVEYWFRVQVAGLISAKRQVKCFLLSINFWSRVVYCLFRLAVLYLLILARWLDHGVAHRLISWVVPLLFIGVANPRNAGWNACCWVLVAGRVSSHLFAIADVANPQILWVLELPIHETPAPSAPLLARQPDQFQIQNQNLHPYLLVDQIGFKFKINITPLLARRLD